MSDLFQNIKKILKKELTILWIFSVLLGLALIALDIKHKLPLGKGDFVFISILALCFALYRPRWVFYIFVSLIPLENVILASGFLPMQLRPYQYTGMILVAAVAILWTSKRLKFRLLKPTWLDWLIFSLVPFSFLSLINSPSKNISLKNNLVLISFVVLFYLVRNFVRSKKDLAATALFFIGSDIIVLVYGFYQVFADKLDGRPFEVMFGRPNATFTEPDWLGIYLCFSLAVTLSLIYFWKNTWGKYATYLLIFLNVTLLILTLSRSAWIGAAAVMFFFLLFNLYQKEKEGIFFTPKQFASRLLVLTIVVLLSLAAVHFGKLSKFDIFDRARSAATNEQKITIACNGDNSNLPQTISNTGELARYGCQHINLEDIASNQAQGKYITEIFRKDPNVMTRSQIYRKSFELVRQHPFSGIGYGAASQYLGTDERGTGLNESNVFLQVWAGSGILGLIAFAAAILFIFMHSFRKLSPFCPLGRWIGCPVVRDEWDRAVALFSILGILALIVPNLFNAGLFMGIFWLGLGALASCRSINQVN